MGFYSFAPLSVPVGGGTFTGVVASGAASGSNTAAEAGAHVLVPTFGNGVAAQLADTSRDYDVYLTVGTGGTAFTVAIGPTSTPANTIVPAGPATSGQVVPVRLPAGWFLEWSATTATLAGQLAIGC
jgi:hypothetical protein